MSNIFKLNKKTYFWIPTEDEWYKAAYYDPTLNGGNGGYWNYATRSNTTPTPVAANSNGDGSAGSEGNFANYNQAANWNATTVGNVTTVGTNGGSSYYGTFDQSGNIHEWNDSVSISGTGRGRRGGDWEDSTAFALSSTGGRRTTLLEPSFTGSDSGFRICSSIYNDNNNFVLVDDINNIADTSVMTDGTSNYGSVNYKYKIAKYEVTNDEYAEFLNNVASIDEYNLYDSFMGSNARGGITRHGTSGNYTYTVKPNMGNKPVIYVSWFNCARYCNWLTNGKPTGEQNNYTTEGGVYNLNGANSTEIILKSSVEPFKIKSKEAAYYIPTEDEWYKAAFYDATLNGGNGGYWTYATKSNSVPTPVVANSVGDGSAGPSGNFANFNRDSDWNNENGVPTTVGTNGGPSYYDTLDQSGNVYEWNDALISLSETDPTTGWPQTNINRGIRGGYWLTLLANDPFRLSTTGRNSSDPSFGNSGNGFRIACKNNILNLPNFVNVNDTNNPNDTTGYGSVPYSYNIGKYEVTNSEYAEFLNSIAATDTYGLYDTNMDSSRCGIIRTGSPGNFVYTVRTNWHNKPVLFINWFRAARYCNWLTNGKPSGLQTKETTESGSYNLYGKTSGIATKGNFKIGV